MPEQAQRQVLPVPDRVPVGLTTYDAKDPDTSFPPIEPIRPPAGAPERPRGAHRRLRVRGVQRLRRADPDADLRPAGRRRAALHPLPHDRSVLAHQGRPPLRPQPPLGGHGRHHRDRDVGAGLQLAAPEHVRPAGRDPQAQRLRDRAVRQVPRGPGVADQPDGAVRQLAQRRRRVRALLRVHRWRDQPVRPGDLPRHDTGRAGPHPGGGLPLHRGHDRPRHRLGPAAEGPDAGQAVLRLLRPRRDPRPAPRAGRVVGALPGEFDQGWDMLREETLVRQQELGVVPADAELTARPDEIPSWESMPDDLKPVLARQMEVYAGFLEHTDHHVGRLVDASPSSARSRTPSST